MDREREELELAVAMASGRWPDGRWRQDLPMKVQRHGSMARRWIYTVQTLTPSGQPPRGGFFYASYFVAACGHAREFAEQLATNAARKINLGTSLRALQAPETSTEAPLNNAPRASID